MINMKRFVYIIASLLMLSCAGAGGFDEQEGTNPLSECVLSATAEAGREGFIQWNGFTKDAKVDLVSSAGNSYHAVVDVVTSSGLVFLIPSDIPAGVYKVKVSMSGKVFEAGEIEIIASEKKPEDEDPEQDPEDDPNEGEGDEPGSDPQPDEGTDDDPNEGTGDDPNEGTGDDTSGDGPEPGDPMEPEIPASKKKLVRLEMIPYLGSSQHMISWDIAEDMLTVSITDVSAGQVSSRDEYSETTNQYSYELTLDENEVSENLEIDYSVSSEGKVVSTELVRFKGTDSVNWMYDSKGRITEVSSSKREYLSIGYDGDNMSSFSSLAFEYGDPSLINNADAADVIWGYMALTTNGYKEPFLYIPYLLGWYREQSAALPTAMSSPSADGESVDTSSLSYDFDEDGYVTGMSWKSGSTQCKVTYIYE